MKARNPLRPAEINQSAECRLFAEGDEESLDAVVLRALLSIRVDWLGKGLSVREVAASLHATHPKYFFLCDRDDFEDDRVQESWARFPDPARSNLLIWRRKELENYFLEPAWLAKSRFLKRTEEALRAHLCEEATRDLYRGAANLTLVRQRRGVKEGTFKRLTGNNLSQADAFAELLARARAFSDTTAEALSEVSLSDHYHATIAELSGGQTPLGWDVGCWRERLDGKRLLYGLLNYGFDVQDHYGAKLNGEGAAKAIAKELLQTHRAEMPADFRELVRLIDEATR